MKKVGIVGGIGPESTISYYHDIVYGVQERIGHPFYPPVSIESIDLFEWVRLCDQKEMEKLISFTVEAVGRLAASGCDFAILAANTAHLIFDEVQEKSPIPLLSIVEACAEEAKRRGCLFAFSRLRGKCRRGTESKLWSLAVRNCHWYSGKRKSRLSPI